MEQNIFPKMDNWFPIDTDPHWKKVSGKHYFMNTKISQYVFEMKIIDLEKAKKYLSSIIHTNVRSNDRNNRNHIKLFLKIYTDSNNYQIISTSYSIEQFVKISLFNYFNNKNSVFSRFEESNIQNIKIKIICAYKNVKLQDVIDIKKNIK